VHRENPLIGPIGSYPFFSTIHERKNLGVPEFLRETYDHHHFNG
jgi:hypothetical protein